MDDNQSTQTEIQPENPNCSSKAAWDYMKGYWWETDWYRKWEQIANHQ